MTHRKFCARTDSKGKPISVLLKLVLSISLVLPYVSFGQDVTLNADKRLSQYVLTEWSVEEGMGSESTNELLQTPDGYMWVATYAGLHRFDGKDFTIYNNKNSDIPSPNVLRLENGKNGAIWIGTHHGVSKYIGGKFERPEPLLPIKDKSIEQMLMTRDGDLWFSTRTNNFYRYGDSTLVEFTQELDLSESTVLSMIETENGDVFFGTDDSRLLVYSNEGMFDEIPLQDNLNGINTFYSDGEVLYVGTGVGLYTWNGQELIKQAYLTNRAVRALLIDQNNITWIGTMSGLFRWDPGKSRLDSLTEATGMPNNIVRDMISDDQGKLWLATYRNGIFLLTDGTISSYTTSDGLATEVIAGITQIGDRRYLLGNENGTLNMIDGEEISIWEPPIPLPSARLKNLFTDRKGRVWVSTYAGLHVLAGSESCRFTVEEGFPDNYIRVANEDSAGTVWIGTKNAGLFKFNSLDSWEHVTIEDGLSSNYIMSIDRGNNGNLIVGTISGLNIIDPSGNIKSITVEEGLPSNFMFATYSTPNFIWIASNDGLTGYSSEKGIVNFNAENGLEANIVYEILADDAGNFWMPSERSIIRGNIEELETAALTQEPTITVKQYDKSYGMKSNNFLGAVHSLKDSEGNLWMPTTGGIVKFKPSEVISPSFDPLMVVEGIVADNTALDLSQQEVTVPSGIDRLQIDFTAINYAQAEGLQFRYKLVPFDEDWVIASPERNAVFTNLPPRSYNFQLQTGIDGEFTEDLLEKSITIEAAWWQTLGAKILFALLIAATALLIYRLRLRALTAINVRLEETVSERTKELEAQKKELNDAIVQLKEAQEQMVHSDKMASLGILSAGVAHEINNPLNFIHGGVEGLGHLLRKGIKPDSDEYTKLIAAIREGIDRASQIVSSLNEFSRKSEDHNEQCDIHRMIENCLTMIQYRFKEGIELEKDFTSEDVTIVGNNGKIHQAFLNIATNAIQAIKDQGTIKIKTSIVKDQVHVEFTDTGQGIKPENLSKIMEPFFSTKAPGKGTGLGLSITYAIIMDHGGQLTYASEWGKGTTARVALPRMKATS